MTQEIAHSHNVLAPQVGVDFGLAGPHLGAPVLEALDGGDEGDFLHSPARSVLADHDRADNAAFPVKFIPTPRLDEFRHFPSPLMVYYRTSFLEQHFGSYSATPFAKKLCASVSSIDRLSHAHSRVIHRGNRGEPYVTLASEPMTSGFSPRSNPIARVPHILRATAARRNATSASPSLRAATLFGRAA